MNELIAAFTTPYTMQSVNLMLTYTECRVHAVEHGHHDVHVHDVERGVFFQKSNGFIED